MIAGIGTMLSARHALHQSRYSALLAGILFALGGYLTAQVEHVNQLQALVWLPWHLYALSLSDWRRRTLAVTGFFSLATVGGAYPIHLYYWRWGRGLGDCVIGYEGVASGAESSDAGNCRHSFAR